MPKDRGLYLRNKTWWICFTGPDGIIRRESTKTTSRREARTILDCKRAAVHKTRLLMRTNPMFRSFSLLVPEIKALLQLMQVED